jgi:MFS family permease
VSSTIPDIGALQRRTVGVLVAGQILGGLGFGATLSMGALLFADVAGNDLLSGMASTMSTLGAAIAAVPLARIAAARGRRISLSTGAGIAAVGAVLTVVAAASRALPLLFVGIALIGMGNAANLQARFAATDLATPQHRGRDLSIVVWTTTIGAVIGPNLLQPGEELGRMIGLPAFTGPFLLTITTQVAAVVLYLTALRPDPLRTAAAIRAGTIADAGAPAAADAGLPRRFYVTAVLAVALSHAVMVSVMAMTPVHLTEHGATLTVVGITISLHVLGMYALSPVFGLLADRLGRPATILVGQALLAAGLVVNATLGESHAGVAVGLTLVGLGWSASTIAGSALVTESTPSALRARNQGRNDLIMSLSGAVGGALAGPVLAAIAYEGLSAIAGVLVVVAVAAVLSLRGSTGLPARA